MKYIHQNKLWPNFTWDEHKVKEMLMTVKLKQAKILGRMEQLGFESISKIALTTLTEDIIKTSEIEGEHLDSEQVRSSVARHLRVDIGGLVKSDRAVDGIVELILDATRNFKEPLTEDRLLNWHELLFPDGISGSMIITTGYWRQEGSDPMQVISGSIGKERVHFEAPRANLIPIEMSKFINWFNADTGLDYIVKSAIAHFWFVTVHPFDDGNGRIARAISDMLLARSENQPNRFYSMSSQIRIMRKEYYKILETVQKGDLNITSWMSWFFNCLSIAIDNAELTLENVLNKSRFWEQNANKVLNKRQIFMLNSMLDGFKGNLTSSKWAKMNKCSQDTATRDINDLINKQILVKSHQGGRSTNYLLLGFDINSK